MQAYPLQYPIGYPRTKHPQRSAFSVSLADARDALLNELRLLGAKSIVISSNALLRNDGLPYAKQPKIEDNGVAVYFFYESQQLALACDKWNDIASNIRAIGLTVSAIRGMERWGVSEMLKRAFAGFQALPENASNGNGYFDGITSFEEARATYRGLVKRFHPDGQSPDAQKFIEVKNQFDLLKKRFEQ